MGKKLDALLGRNFKTARFKATANLAISRLAVLKNQRQARCSIARSDVVQLLNLGHHERALLRVEQVIKEQNMLDVFVMVEGYCLLLVERINLLEHEKVCPEELKEAISSLIYAASRCGEFPELQELRVIFTSRFGKEFTARAVELRNNCGVNPKMIQKLSTRMPSLEHRTKVLKEIASENNIVLQIEEAVLETTEKKDTVKRQDQPEGDLSSKSGEYRYEGRIPVLPQDGDHEVGRKYKDVADAAQAAFESAAYAAAAARAAVELSRSESRDPDDPNSPSQKPRAVSDYREDLKSKFRAGEEKNNKEMNVGDVVEKIQPTQNYGFHSEANQLPDGDEEEELKERKFKEQFKRSVSASSSDSADDILDDEVIRPGHGVIFDEIDDVGKKSRIPSLKSPKSEVFGSEKSNSKDVSIEGAGRNSWYFTDNEISPGYQAGNEKEVEGFTKQGAENLDINKTPISVRTRRNYHW
uniref:Uncharacterized protein LOC104221270 isoform X2 n=1 Tax=Nicotiana sylvestris TaxID=4096 RepID=A0A1U7VW44_NICSY|nr:PREDICTED: uncharacterized protein LOC104221270 isoform X2 [Nicotiana sylvestris]